MGYSNDGGETLDPTLADTCASCGYDCSCAVSSKIIVEISIKI